MCPALYISKVRYACWEEEDPEVWKLKLSLIIVIGSAPLNFPLPVRPFFLLSHFVICVICRNYRLIPSQTACHTILYTSGPVKYGLIARIPVMMC